MEWFDEKIEDIKGDKFIYKIICFLLGGRKKRLSYKQVYLILYGINKSRYGVEKAKKLAMSRILDIYASHHNNNYPKDFKI
jgi:hypothetical protein